MADIDAKQHGPDTIARFSNRVANYVRYRPHYPREIIEFFKTELGLGADSLIADVGSGTGISSKLFLENGNTVYGVEPNVDMRNAAEGFLKDFARFHSVAGTSEESGLSDNSIDIVIAAQAFHWFRPDETRREFQRILKPGGCVALIWNERQLATTPFLIEYEKFLVKHALDYSKVRHDNLTGASLRNFFAKPFKRATFANAQVLDFDGILGRAASSSYMPAEADAAFPAMAEELKILFANHAQNGRISVFYDTNVYYAQY